MLAPAIPQILRQNHSANRTLGSFVVSSFQLGYTIGPFFIAPMSEVYGRVALYHTCNILFCIFLVASAVSSSLAQLMVFRVLSGVVGVCPIAIGSGTIADMVPREKMAGVLAIWSLGPLLGPVLSPIVGGVLAERAGWRWTFWLCLILAGIILAVSLCVYRESYAPVLLRRRAIRALKQDNRDSGNVPPLTAMKPLLVRALRRPLKLLVRSPIVAILSSYIGITFGYFYLLFTTFAEAFETCYDFSQQSAGFAYLGFGVGASAGLAMYSWYANRRAAKMFQQGRLTPESRLIPAMYGCLLVPVGLFVYGWTLDRNVDEAETESPLVDDP
ncbi:hypothetical protein NQ176_g398 [Zarea fungicola]|uniref:Uncharacterized protein n=1 Tax=Zarea fungicola TaxID=93591 RepID=A0ACC1NWZ7_9HYPO|nr:hypothetical protein NQ176_g398 [Lecanicillium fungicola]